VTAAPRESLAASPVAAIPAVAPRPIDHATSLASPALVSGLKDSQPASSTNCLACGYDLTGLRGGSVCPECGILPIRPTPQWLIPGLKLTDAGQRRVASDCLTLGAAGTLFMLSLMGLLATACWEQRLLRWAFWPLVALYPISLALLTLAAAAWWARPWPMMMVSHVPTARPKGRIGPGAWMFIALSQAALLLLVQLDPTYQYSVAYTLITCVVLAGPVIQAIASRNILLQLERLARESGDHANAKSISQSRIESAWCVLGGGALLFMFWPGLGKAGGGGPGKELAPFYAVGIALMAMPLIVQNLRLITRALRKCGTM